MTEIVGPTRILQCPKCQLRLPLRADHNYFGDYRKIDDHSTGHEPPVVGAWPEAPSPAKTWDDMKPNFHYPITERPQTIYLCADANCDHWFSSLSEIPQGWTVTSSMVFNTRNTTANLHYRCLCPAHQEQGAANSLQDQADRVKGSYDYEEFRKALIGSIVASYPERSTTTNYTPPLSDWSESIKKNHEHQDKPMDRGIGSGVSFDHARCACGATTEMCLNPDAVAVKWYECALCGRTRSVTVSTEVW